MALVMKILGSIIAPLLLLYIGWRGIEPAKRKGALKVILIMFAVMSAGTLLYIVIMFEMASK